MQYFIILPFLLYFYQINAALMHILHETFFTHKKKILQLQTFEIMYNVLQSVFFPHWTVFPTACAQLERAAEWRLLKLVLYGVKICY